MNKTPVKVETLLYNDKIYVSQKDLMEFLTQYSENLLEAANEEKLAGRMDAVQMISGGGIVIEQIISNLMKFEEHPCNHI